MTEGHFEPLLDTEEAARLLRMHPRTLRTKRCPRKTHTRRTPKTGFYPGGAKLNWKKSRRSKWKDGSELRKLRTEPRPRSNA